MSTDTFQLSAALEWVGHDPFGSPKPADVSPRAAPPVDGSVAVALRAARNGYASFRLLVRGSGEYRLDARMSGGLEADLFRAWYHHTAPEKGEAERGPACLPDALVPVRPNEVFRLPDPDNNVPGQTVQEFWVDIFVPAEAEPGPKAGSVSLSSGRRAIELPVRLEVLELAVPEEPCIQMDHNSYGCRDIPGRYPGLFAGARRGERFWNAIIEVLHNRFRLFHEHRGLYHNLGHGHSGAADPIYRPEASGGGRDRRLTDWTLYDRHYGPLLDGSAFAKPAAGAPRPRRAASPLWAVYTPISPDWPASYLNWGEPGYEAEFTNCLRQFDGHLREKGWTGTHIEFFFNHKRDYRWFDWHGDEIYLAEDIPYMLKMGKLWKPVVEGSPVKWIYRADVSTQQKAQGRDLAGYVTFWICNEYVRWYRREVEEVIARGDIVWTYGGLPPITWHSAAVLEPVFRTWVRGFAGYLPWSATNVGDDPWFDFRGARTGIVYPGERFGIAGPIPSIRLKLQRNAIQDVDLISKAHQDRPAELAALREELIGRYPIAGCAWEKPPRVVLEVPPEQWNGYKSDLRHEPIAEASRRLDPLWWQDLRRMALGGEAR